MKIIFVFFVVTRDWRGLAEILGVPAETKRHWESFKEPSLQLIKEWPNLAPDEATVGGLIRRLAEIDRFDIIDDFKEDFGKLSSLDAWVNTVGNSTVAKLHLRQHFAFFRV